MIWILRLKKLLLPPCSSLLVGCVGLALLLLTPFARSGIVLIVAGFLSLYILSLPAVVVRWLQSVDRYPRPGPDNPGTRQPEAMVILDGGRMTVAPEQGGEKVTPRTLERLDAGARLHRRTGLPILVTGHGDLIASVLRDSFTVEVRWIENHSRNTHENAMFSTALLKQESIHHIYLVTHYWHMRRSLAAFRHAGIEATAAPATCAPRLPRKRGLMEFVPGVTMLAASTLLIHEWIGRLWYRIRYGYE